MDESIDTSVTEQPDAGTAGTPAAPEVAAAPTETPEGAASQGVAKLSPAPGGKVWGLDLSYYRVSAVQAQDLYAAGYRVAFQCLWTGEEQPAPAQDNVRTLAAAGFIVCGYISVSRGNSGIGHVEAGYDSCAQDVQALLRHVAVDVELPGLDLWYHVEGALQALSARGFERLVYTNYNTWVNLLGNPTLAASTSLWNAYWDDDPDYDFEHLPYGGGMFKLIGEQYTGGQSILGVLADHDIFEEAFFAPVPYYSVRDIAFICSYIATALHQAMPVALSPKDAAILRDYVGKL